MASYQPMILRTPRRLWALVLLVSPALLFCQQSQPNSQQPPSSTSTAPVETTGKTNPAQPKQQNSSSKKDSSTPAKQPVATAPAAASDNAFPEAQSEAAAKAKNAPPVSQNTTSDDNPFPESQSAAAAKDPASDSTPDAADGNKPLKLSPLPGVSSSNANLPAQDLGRKTKRHEKEDEFTRDLNPTGRLEDDLKVASFYMKDWNYKGAYLRYRDALQFDSSNQDALFGVAQASCMQNMTDEATEQFKEYLLQYPTGKRAKEAQKALNDPKKCADNR